MDNGEHQNQSELDEQEQIMSKLNIHQRISAIMAEISYIQKGDAKVNNQYSFVGHDAVTAALHPLFVKHGINCYTSVTGHKQDGNRSEASISMTFVNIDDSSETVVVDGFGHGIDPQDKGPGKAVSYAVKMLLLKTFLLETGDRDNEADNINHVTADATAMVEKIKQAELTGDWVTLSMLSRTEEWLTAWPSIDTHRKGKINKLTAKATEYRDALNDKAETDNPDSVLELWDELEKDGKKCIWPMLTNNTQDFITKLKEDEK